MTDYNDSVWRSIGHPAFDDEYMLETKDIEWWNVDEKDENEQAS
jgi:hypothetical protein